MKILVLSTVFVLLAACSSKHEDLKSPCVGIEKSPCNFQPINERIA